MSEYIEALEKFWDLIHAGSWPLQWYAPYYHILCEAVSKAEKYDEALKRNEELYQEKQILKDGAIKILKIIDELHCHLDFENTHIIDDGDGCKTYIFENDKDRELVRKVYSILEAEKDE